MKKIIGILSFIMATISVCHAQDYTEVKIWPDGLPNSNGRDLTEPYNDEAGNYEPRIHVFLPPKEKATGRAVLCIPGGGYGTVCYDVEGGSWAPYFLERGIALIALKYRLPFGSYASVPSSDAFEAMRIIRRHAAEWNIDPHKVGVMGHSAGGHLAATVATLARDDAKPDFQILFYPVITMDKRYTHMGTHDNLIGRDAGPELENYYSCEKQVRPGNAPALILTTDDDETVPSENSVNYYLALKNAGVDASLHIYPSGSHGFSHHKWFRSHDVMISDLFSWIASLK